MGVRRSIELLELLCPQTREEEDRHRCEQQPAYEIKIEITILINKHHHALSVVGDSHTDLDFGKGSAQTFRMNRNPSIEDPDGYYEHMTDEVLGKVTAKKYRHIESDKVVYILYLDDLRIAEATNKQDAWKEANKVNELLKCKECTYMFKAMGPDWNDTASLDDLIRACDALSH